MQKLRKSKTPKVYKNKKLNNANFGTYNLNDYQVFLQLISMIGGVDELGKYLQPQELQREHILTAKAFSEQFNVELDGAYTTLKRVAKKLTETSLTLEKPELFVTQHIALCSQTEYNHKQGSLTVKFTEEIMPYLAQVKSKFVLYNLKEVANFGSLYSTRLYELIQEFKDTGYIMKSVTQLRDLFVVGKKFPLYGNFKAKTFGHAVEEINSQYELNLRFEEIKDGRKVVAIRFEFTPTFSSKGYNPATKEMVSMTVKPRRKQQEQPELPNLEPTLVARRAKEKEYRDRHKAKKDEKLTHIDHISDAEIEAQELLKNINMLDSVSKHREDLILPEPSILLDEEELKDFINAPTEIDPEIEKIVQSMSKQEIFNLVQQAQKAEEEAKKIINPETKPRKKIFGIF
jgi:plasmid replication initiation protein